MAENISDRNDGAAQEARAVIAEIAAERRRQIEAEGFDASHDNGREPGELAMAGACYARYAAVRMDVPDADYRNGWVEPSSWPWAREWWKPKNRRHDLIRAAALIVAEIERLDRLAKPTPVRCNDCDFEGDATELLEEGHCPNGCHATAVSEVDDHA